MKPQFDKEIRMKRRRCFATLLGLCLITFSGCQDHHQPQGGPGAPSGADARGPLKQALPLDGPDVVIESVPSEADVYLIPTDEAEKSGEGKRRLGKTPLKL